MALAVVVLPITAELTSAALTDESTTYAVFTVAGVVVPLVAILVGVVLLLLRLAVPAAVGLLVAGLFLQAAQVVLVYVLVLLVECDGHTAGCML